MIFNSWSKRDFSNGRRGMVKVLEQLEPIINTNSLEALHVDNGRNGIIIFLLGDSPGEEKKQNIFGNTRKN